MPSKPALHRSNDRARLVDARRERSGSFGLSRSLLGLTHGSVTRPSRTFEGFRPRQPTRSHRCDRAVNLWIHSPSKRSPVALTGVSLATCRHATSKAGLLSWGLTPPETSPPRRCHPPLHRPLFRAPLARSPAASTPSRSLARPTFGLKMPLSKSRSALVVSHHLDGLLRNRLAGLLHPAADHGVRHVSHRSPTPPK